MDEFTNYGFQVGVWNFDFVRGQFDSQVSFFFSCYSNVACDPAYLYLFWVGQELNN